MKMLTVVERYPTDIGIARLFGALEKIIHCNHGTALSCDKDKDLVTIHHSKVDRAYARIRY